MEHWKSALEEMVIEASFWEGKKVIITGHTGFKGGWLSLQLQSLGVDILGIGLRPNGELNLYDQASVFSDMESIIEDIRNRDNIKNIFKNFNPDIVFHLAAQPLVRDSYMNPVETYEVNVIGTLNVLEAMRGIPNLKAGVMITTDKCYENLEKEEPYKEDEPMGGYDPYSSSKGASELLISSYRNSFFSSNIKKEDNIALSSVRAGNVIGGGDWAKDRLIPDLVRAKISGEELEIRNPEAIRPWQHVLEPLNGYILLAEKLYLEGETAAEAWNFGPNLNDSKSVGWIADTITKDLKFGKGWKLKEENNKFHEAKILKLDSTKAITRLGWKPKLSLNESLKMTVDWYKALEESINMKDFCFYQIKEYNKLKS